MAISKKHYTPIHVDEIASRIAKVYEKIRKIIDWKDDNALRRSAIERILKRIIFPNLAGLTTKKAAVDELSETITVELIRGGHLPNDTIPMERLSDVANILKKYLVFLKSADKYDFFAVKQKINYTNFILEIAACEIEEVLTNPVKEYGIINTMSSLLYERINFIPKDHLKEDDIRKYILIATIKTLYDLDDKFITYILLKQKYVNWNSASDEELEKISKELPNVWSEIGEDLKRPYLRKFIRIAENVDTVFLLVDDILSKYKDDPGKIKENFEDHKKLEKLLTKSYESRYKTLKTRLFRLAIFSTLSVFLSNWVTFFIVEVPLANIFAEGFSFRAAVIDFVLPTAVMFFLVIIIRLPKKNNINKVIDLAFSFIYQDEEKRLYQIRFENKRPSMIKIIMTSLYFEIIIFTFIGIAYAFYIANLPISSVVFDTFTISLTVFAAVAIKNKSRELSVDEDTSVGSFLLDMLSVPVAKVGSVFARKWKEYNIVAILFNFLIETPFAVILNIIQGWSDFISERKQELH
ncbi:MAG: hypothetical protein JW870_13530 [Candidatus Delongbacteria bacterium]|nr:hypothetical protein [Candidatus Delongbacteria bacterium]